MEAINVPAETVQYARELYQRDDAVLADLQRELASGDLPQINVGPEEGKLLQMLVVASGGRRVLEIGTLAGYSAIWMARGLAPNGKLISLEMEARHAEVARRYIEQAGLGEKVEIRLGSALETLPTLTDEAPFDLAFIDADKGGYPAYLEWALRLVRPGGWITAHNTFGWNNLPDQSNQEPNVVALRRFNQAIADHPDLLATIIPVEDGLTVALKLR
jgi:caffeoyl-CoA O-methyltransferase